MLGSFSESPHYAAQKEIPTLTHQIDIAEDREPKLLERLRAVL